MKKMNLTEVLNDHIEDLINYLKHKIKIIGIANGLSDSQISDMERDFIARLAFAAIIGDEKESEKEPEKKPEDLPEYIVKALSYVNDYCNGCDCTDCIFCDLDGCKIKYTPNEWRISKL